ncbi:ADP-ribosylation [Rhizophagus irregularis]|uniref:Poly [ADP-ribose] polymerase n=2 Tax=Rhizophagus irregularis TaxID=588596 RepID=U9UJ83_RHIID|nr:hypothetical protein GLOIN_2v1576898 [Rhizophagus irregularis DAOM 181602=DAOM 197198]PKC14955.1 ADP-ribosylation [Rhizophagus irregularis]PKC75539.1 ADP-ribosylation [Rhizophagus irregularis]PKY16296.1 ADP-ribosylation [Rhizophagus irregularis]POG74418.1 hypothetical protein GLOIN_2v1576898 [Rhizophagus irregularis DAOM 181602=DAOM 197198]UZO29032.1 hypothetical protein OCT59_022529 [Rhizophagus irregularis]|eukprot:XP_025181284.1 hypothetical protein GLOIN_2v1576898 [Rhizophagus irregularis DAOM 181602=DAOM 197198]
MAQCCLITCNNKIECEDFNLCVIHLKELSSGNLSSTIQIKSSEDTTHLIEIPRKSTEFSDIENKFLGDWVKPNTQGLRVEAIFSIILPKSIVNNYKSYRSTVESRGKFKSQGLKEGDERILYHGTDHNCAVIYDALRELCKSSNCAGCGILMNSFKLDKVGINKQGRSFQRLGQGIYFTPYSSKAHFYGHGGAKPLPTEAGRTCRMMFMTKVVLGNTWQPDRVSQNCRSPPAGHDSTWGRVGKCPHGGAVLNYEEYAVYRNDACLPSKYIAYSYTSTNE